ncbi:hypothetical protein [Stieleria maiorica]|nr:hypothetical protein [Stieleria maiorica]
MSDVAEALRLHDLDLKVVVGGLDDPETYRLLRTESAARVKVIAQGCAYNHMNQFRSDGTTS